MSNHEQLGEAREPDGDRDSLAAESPEEILADASWAAGLLSEQDWYELQSTGQAIASGREVFYLGIYKYVGEAKTLVEAYSAADNAVATDEQLLSLNDFMHQLVVAFYSMCVEHGVLEAGFWKDQ